MMSLPDLSQLSRAQKDALIIQLFQTVQSLVSQMDTLQKRITELERRPRLSSKNSSKPSFSDGLAKPTSKPNPKSLHTPGQNPNGGQPGHSGNTLMQSAQPDVFIRHTHGAQCSVCHSTQL